MSSVTEVRHQSGGFRVDLKDGLPPSVSRGLSLARTAFSFVVITPQWVHPGDFSPPTDPVATPHPLLDVARYAGVLRATSSRRRTLEGEGLLSLLGTQDESPGSGFGQWSTQMTDLRVANNAYWWATLLTVGGSTTSTTGVPLNFAASHLRTGTRPPNSGPSYRLSDLRTYRAMLNEVCWQSGYVYRVDPNGVLHVGTRATIYGATPRVVAGTGLPGDRDPRWITIRTAIADWGESVDTYLTGAVGDPPADYGVFVPGTFTNSSGTAHFNVPTKNYPHNPMLNVSVDSDEDRTEWENRTTWIVADRNRVIYTAQFSGQMVPDVRLIPGEPLWLWDAEIGLEDAANAITYAGEPIRPQSAELAAYTWPIREGMGVYLLSRHGGATTITDLTEFVAFTDDPTVSFEVGQAVRPM